MIYPPAPGTHVFTLHGKDGDRWATCSCNWVSEHVFTKQQCERQCEEHAYANPAPLCLVCGGSGRAVEGTNICKTCGGTGRVVA